MTAALEHRFTELRRRGWRAYADARRALRGGASPGASALARPRSSSLDEWLAVTSERHARYRATHDVPHGGVAVICVSKRPERLADVIASTARQHDVAPELIFVPHGPGWDVESAEAAVRTLNAGRVVEAGVGSSLGAALNAATAVTSARFVAKFDDDDHYGPFHLADLLRAHGYARAGVVGRHSYYARVAGIPALQLRFPGNEFRYSSTLSGGTLVIDRERTGDLAFADISLGEDRAFLAACHRRGISTYAADRFNFVQHRGRDNTWTVTATQFLEGCREVDDSLPFHQVDR